MTEQRRLAAIVSADVAGYSRLMGREQNHNVILGLDRKMCLPPYPQRFKLNGAEIQAVAFANAYCPKTFCNGHADITLATQQPRHRA
jgi:hypothetical protein